MALDEKHALLTQANPSLSVTLANTDYLEIQSETYAATYAIWVTYPPGYDPDGNVEYPVLYVLDGNIYAAMLGPMCQMLAIDPIERYLPYIQVSVGFTEEDADDYTALRTRDLIPPGEPLAESFRELVTEQAGAAGLTDQDLAKYFEMLEDSHADRFLRFFEDQLIPAIRKRYRVQAGPSGLFGYSYGGLFALYALCRSTAFSKIGSGSPAIFTPDSRVFALERELAANGQFVGERRLHLTLCEREMTGRCAAFQNLSTQFASILSTLRRTGHKGLKISAEVLPNETHSTGIMASFIGFMRACYLDGAASR